MWADFDANVRCESRCGETVAFFYYSGHGMIHKADPHEMTWIVHNNDLDEHTPIEKKLHALSKKSNVTIFALLDCCRLEWSK